MLACCTDRRCQHLADWGPDEWSGRARMASARRAAGLPLDGLDLDALDRVAP